MDPVSQFLAVLDRELPIGYSDRTNTLDTAGIETTCPLDGSRYAVNPKHDLGSLDRFPMEILSDVLAEIDVRSLMDFRRVNKRAMQVVDGQVHFQMVIKHCPSLLRGILSIEVGSYVTSKDMYRALTTSSCANCGDFGGFVYLFNCSRACMTCVSEEEKYLPLLRSEAKRSFGLCRHDLQALPSMRSVPGRYAPKAYSNRSRLVLIDAEAARLVGVARHGSTSAMEEYADFLTMVKTDEYYDRLALSQAIPIGYVPRRPPSPERRDRRSAASRPFMAVVRAPYVDLTNYPYEEWGFRCLGCKERTGFRPTNCLRRFTDISFLAHIEECGPIVNGNHLRPRVCPI